MTARFNLLCLALLLLFASSSMARGITYVVLWFDTEDYVDPIADDAALRIANDLTSLGVHGTFKVVGEKARVLQQRGRIDVIQALGRHCIGYHSNWHSVQPVPALALQHLGLLEGADKFERRQRTDYEDVARIFGVRPACYGQPGSSWAPQSNLALRRMGVHVYLDEGTQVGYGDQPIWFGGLLYVFNLGRYQIRADIDGREPESEAFRRFDAAAKHVTENGGGLISTMYHPTEIVHTEFWDGVNFAHGEVRPRQQWVLPRRRNKDDAERCFRVLKDYVEHAKSVPGVEFVTAHDLLRIYANPIPPAVSRIELGQHFQRQSTSCQRARGTFPLPIFCWNYWSFLRNMLTGRHNAAQQPIRMRPFLTLCSTPRCRIYGRSFRRIIDCRVMSSLVRRPSHWRTLQPH